MGVEKAAAFVYEMNQSKIGSQNVKLRKRTVAGYSGTMYSESVAVGNRPISFLALMAELAAAGFPEDALELEELLCPWLRVARTPAKTAPTTTRTPTGAPNLIHLLRGFLLFGGAI